MCLKHRRVVNKKADRRGEVEASKSENTRREKRGPLY
jgi:hypothetical protein